MAQETNIAAKLRAILDDGDRAIDAGVPAQAAAWTLIGQVRQLAAELEEQADEAGTVVYVDRNTPPPLAVAYAEDNRDRLWTGKEWGGWTCLHASGLGPMSWDQAWDDHGPMVPLVPATPGVKGS